MSASNSASNAESASLSHLTRPGASRYRVFLSYSHADTKWARWLMRKLESYSVPKRFHGRVAPIGDVSRRIAPVFRDRDELPTTSDLGETIRNALRESATLVVICSPASARSRWVQEEIRAFKRLHGERRVFAFIVSGEPKVAGAADDCFSPALRVELGADGQMSARPAEVVAADARAESDGPKLAFIRLVAGLLGVGFDELRQRELQRRNRRLMVITGCSVAGMALTFGLAVVAWQARNDARRRQDQAEDVLTFMLGDFRDELKKIGRLGLLDQVGDKSITYFDSLDARDLTDLALARQAKALTQIGENQLEQAKYPAAARAFMTAYQRAAALAERQPQNAEMLFERGQAEFWVGAVHRRQANFDAAREWFVRYRDTSAALVALAPDNPKWQLELASGSHNLAALHLDRGEFAAAQAGFEAKLATVSRMLAAEPENTDLIYRVANTRSWLGTVAERHGEFVVALAHFEAEGAGHTANAAREPTTARWRFELADCLSLQADMLAITGQREKARMRLTEARALLDALVLHDPANRSWQSSALLFRLRHATLEIADGKAVKAHDLVSSARASLEKLAAAAPTDRLIRARLAAAWRTESECLQALRRPEAYAAATRAMELFELQARDGTTSATARVDLARAAVVAGRIALSRNDIEAARGYARRALEILGDWRRTSYWRMLDPAARALVILGDISAAQEAISRLDRCGYRPLETWPEIPSSITPRPVPPK